MENNIEKAKANKIDLINKVIYLTENIQLSHNDKVINRDGDVYDVDFSGDSPFLKYKGEDGTFNRYGEITEHFSGYAKLDKSLEELDSDAYDVILGKKKIEEFEIKSEVKSTDNQLVHLKSSDTLVKVKNELEIKQNYTKALQYRLTSILESKRRKQT